MAITPDRSDWHRRYDESLAKERAAVKQAGDLTGTEAAAIEASGCLPGWVGVAVLAVTGVLAFIRRRRRRT